MTITANFLEHSTVAERTTAAISIGRRKWLDTCGWLMMSLASVFIMLFARYSSRASLMVKVVEGSMGDGRDV